MSKDRAEALRWAISICRDIETRSIDAANKSGGHLKSGFAGEADGAAMVREELESELEAMGFPVKDPGPG